jgi:hypothetical protein
MDHPHLEACFLERMEMAKDKTQLNNGDNAEEAIIQSIEKNRLSRFAGVDK